MNFTRFFLLVTALICTNLANAGALGEFLKKELGDEAKGFDFVDSNISFHTGAVGSVYNISALNPQGVFMENFELFNMPPYKAETLSEEQLKDLENGFGQDYLTTVPPIWENISFSDAELNRFASKVVVPKIAGMIDASFVAEFSKWGTQTVAIDKIVRRKLYRNGSTYFKYIKGLDPEDEVRIRYMKDKRFAFVSEDILVTGFTATICHGADVDVGLKVELGGLEIAGQAFDRVMALLRNNPGTPPSGGSNTGNSSSTSGTVSLETCLDLFNKEIANIETADTGSEASAVTNPRTINCARRMGPAYCKKYSESGLGGPGIGVQFGHFGEKCIVASAKAPFVVARKITVQRTRKEQDRDPRKEICTEGLFWISESEKVSSHSYVTRVQSSIDSVLNYYKVGDTIALCLNGDATGVFEEISSDHLKIKLITGDDPRTSGPEIDWGVQSGKFENWDWSSTPQFDWVLGSGTPVNPPKAPPVGNYSDI
jgi:hypothetical protein